MGEQISLALRTIFPENMALAFLLGMCSFIACSKKIETAHGLGIAVIFVLWICGVMNWVILKFLLEPGILNFNQDLTYLAFLCFIATIAATTQFLEMFLDKYIPALYMSLGVFLPLISVNCAILGGNLFMMERDYDFISGMNYNFSSGLGWYLAIVFLAGIRDKLRYANIPDGLRGLGITYITAGLMAMCFMTFAGL